jgi:FkbM family methyltransferase
MSARAVLKALVKSALRRAGLEVRRVRRRSGHSARNVPPNVAVHDRASLPGGLSQSHVLGRVPKTCIDVGAAFGNFTVECAQVFPNADYLLVEPLEEYRPFLEAVTARMPRARYAAVAAAARSGEVTLNVHADLVGSSLLRETEGPATDGVVRVVRAQTVDELCQAHDLRGPYLLKADVQGAELDVLEGARAVLRDTEYVLLEVSLFRFFLGGPEVADVIAFMRSCGFVPYDVFHLMYRPLDGALSQFDLAFVKETGMFRQQHVYATPEQRRAQDARFAEMVARSRAGLGARQTPA